MIMELIILPLENNCGYAIREEVLDVRTTFLPHNPRMTELKIFISSQLHHRVPEVRNATLERVFNI